MRKILIMFAALAVLFGLRSSAFVQPGWSYSYTCSNQTNAILFIQGGPLLDGPYALELRVTDSATGSIIIDNTTFLTYYTFGVSQPVVSSTGSVSIILYEKIRTGQRLQDDRIYEPVNHC